MPQNPSPPAAHSILDDALLRLENAFNRLEHVSFEHGRARAAASTETTSAAPAEEWNQLHQELTTLREQNALLSDVLERTRQQWDQTRQVNTTVSERLALTIHSLERLLEEPQES